MIETRLDASDIQSYGEVGRILKTGAGYRRPATV
jgi:hypothetical protein